MKTKIIQNIKSIILALILVLGVSYVSATGTWVAPTATAPGDNTDTPLNVGSIGQIKAGGLTLNTGGAANGLIVQSGKVGIGTTGPNFKLDVSGLGGLMVASGLNLDPNGGPSLASLANSGKMLMGWNRSAGGGEIDLISNRSAGSVGGFNFYDYTNAGALNHLVTIQGAGNVGIGITSPGQKLDVNGYVKGTGMCIGASCITAWPSGGGVSGTVNYIPKFATSTTLGNSSIFDNGNVGIGGTTSPRSALEVTGDIISGGANTWMFHTPDDGRTSLYFGNGTATGGMTSWPFEFTAAGAFKATSLCIGGDCKTAWPGGLSGSGTANYLSKWTAGTTLGNSLFYDDGTNAGAAINGDFYIVNPSMNGYKNVYANDYYINSIGKWTSQLAISQQCITKRGAAFSNDQVIWCDSAHPNMFSCTTLDDQAPSSPESSSCTSDGSCTAYNSTRTGLGAEHIYLEKVVKSGSVYGCLAYDPDHSHTAYKLDIMCCN